MSTALAPKFTPKATSCAHCGLPVPAGLVRHDSAQQFCCSGCALVFETLRGSGLDVDYYAIRQEFESAGDAEPSRATGRAYEAFDRPAFQAEFVKLRVDADGRPGSIADVEFLLEGVHCAACVWLVERLGRVVPGVVGAKLRVRDARVVVTFDGERTQPSAIAKGLDQLGYPAHPSRAEESVGINRAIERRRLIDMGVAGACAGNAMLVAFALYSGKSGGLEEAHAQLFRFVGLGLGWLAILWPGRSFLQGAIAALRTRTGHLDLPISIALVAGALAGTWNTLSGRGEAYFDSLSVLVFLLLVGRYVQARQQRWAADAVDLTRALTPATCRVVRQVGRAESIEEITTPELAVGDIVEVLPGEPLPGDGSIVAGQSVIDRALLSGESMPVSVGVGDEVHAGCQNIAAVLRVEVTSLGAASRVGRLMGLVEEGLDRKPAIERFTDRIAGGFVVVVCALGLATFLYWCWQGNVGAAVDRTVALLIVACPCALGLATPLTLAVAVGQAARRGVLVKDASIFERLAGRGRLLIDKTGTLTYGEARVAHFEGDLALRGPVAILEAQSNHPLARALCRDLDQYAVPGMAAKQVAEKLDGGISGWVNGDEIRVGSRSYLSRLGHGFPKTLAQRAEEMEAQGRSVVGIARRGADVAALAGLIDTPRHDAAETVEKLRAAGWQAEVLSGDSSGAVERVARTLRIDDHRGQIEPEGKLARVLELQSSGHVAVMVGDGVNDAAALAAADVGIAVHGGAETSLAAADVYVSKPGLSPVASLRDLAGRTMWTIRLNLCVSLAYNAVGVSLAATGYVDPLMAAILMPVSSVTVLTLALVSLGSSPRPNRLEASCL